MKPLASRPGWATEALAWFGLAASFVVALQAVLYLLVVGLAVLPGWQAVAIESGSMRPTLDIGDVVLVREIERPEAGEAVLVRADGERALLHRLVEWQADGTAITQGDANDEPDSVPVEAGDIVGVGRIALPAIGLPSIWLAEGRYLDLLFATIAELLILGAARYGITDRRGGFAAFTPLSAFHLSQLR